MNYEQKYKEALERARKIHNDTGFDYEKGMMEEVFPELSESEDEKIRKAILAGLIDCRDAPDLGWSNFGGIDIDECIAWFEKQGEKFKTDEVRLPKFKVGDWVVANSKIGWRAPLQIVDVDNSHVDVDKNAYRVVDVNGNSGCPRIKFYDVNYHLFTIEDAKPGDVLNSNGAPFIYKKHDKNYVYFYCGINLAGEFIKANNIEPWDNNSKVYPATKEQRDTLMKAMANAGYMWDSENKVLKEIINE